MVELSLQCSINTVCMGIFEGGEGKETSIYTVSDLANHFGLTPKEGNVPYLSTEWPTCIKQDSSEIRKSGTPPLQKINT